MVSRNIRLKLFHGMVEVLIYQYCIIEVSINGVVAPRYWEMGDDDRDFKWIITLAAITVVILI